MNSSEHKAKAEFLLDEATEAFSYESQQNILLRAQVHATLATLIEPLDVKDFR